MNAASRQTSKLISYWLRHHPEGAALQVDDFGWSSIDELLRALAAAGIHTDMPELLRLNHSFDKVRWEIDAAGRRIRATHGHSIPVILEEKAAVPPGVLYHGTAAASVNAIVAAGLQPQGRQFVHLSATVETAISVGSRHGTPIILEIDTERLVADGWQLYHTGAEVWLTTAIPSRYLSFRPWLPLADAAHHLVAELKREIGNRQTHFLYPHLHQLEAVWQSSASDDVLFRDRTTGTCYAIHLTYTGMEQEKGAWPRIETFPTLEDWYAKGLRKDQQHFYDLK